MGSFLFLTTSVLFLVLFVKVVGYIHLDAELVPEFVDTSTLGTNDAADIFPVDVKFGELQSNKIVFNA